MALFLKTMSYHTSGHTLIELTEAEAKAIHKFCDADPEYGHCNKYIGCRLSRRGYDTYDEALEVLKKDYLGEYDEED